MPEGYNAVPLEPTRGRSATAGENGGEGSAGGFTVQQAIDSMGFGWFQGQLFLICGLVWMADAMTVMTVAFLMPAVREEFDLSKIWETNIAVCVFVGNAAGASLWGLASDMFGRRFGYVGTTVVVTVSAFACAFAPSLHILLITLFFLGFGTGGLHVVFSLFGEFLPTQLRGPILLSITGFWTLGAIGTALTAWALIPCCGWRYLIGATGIPVGILSLFSFFIPESPRYLSVKVKNDQLSSVVDRVARVNGKDLPEGELKSVVQSDMPSVSYSKIFTAPFTTTSLLIIPTWFVYALVYYGVTLLTVSFLEFTDDADDSTVYKAFIVTASAEVPGLIIAVLCIDRIGRRMTQAFLYTLCALFLAALLMGDSRSAFLIVAAAGARGSILGASAATMVYTPEVYPTVVRSRAMGTCATASRIGAIIAPIVSNYLITFNKNVPVIVFSSLSVVAALCTFFLPFETTNMELQDTAPPPDQDDGGGEGGRARADSATPLIVPGGAAAMNVRSRGRERERERERRDS